MKQFVLLLTFIILLINSTFSQFGPETIVASGQNGPGEVKTFDLDGDGDMDVLANLKADNKVTWYENLGGGTFGPVQVISTIVNVPESIYAADLDNDGDLDVLSASFFDDKIAWYENLGGGVFGPQQIISVLADGAMSVYAADLDNDGDQDVMSASRYDDEIAWYENLGGGTFGAQQVLNNTQNEPEQVYAADMDNDGDIDILSASDYKLGKFENLGGGTFNYFQVNNLSGPNATRIRAVDLDNDGDNDILFGYSANVCYQENLGGGSFSTTQYISAINGQSGLTSVEGVDVDSDGDIDVVSSTSSTGISWYENLGGNTFGPRQTALTASNFTKTVYPGDIDGDGDLDLVYGSYNADKIGWLENFYNSPFTLSGNTYYDANQNKLKDVNEAGLSFVQINTSPSNVYSFTNNGFYANTGDSGTYSISYAIDTLWKLTTDSSTYNRTLTGANPVVNNLDFGFYPDTIITIVNPNLTGGFPRCNGVVNYWASIRNYGTTTPSGIIHLNLDNNITYVGASTAPDSIINQNYYWHYDSLLYYTSETINLQVLMPSFTSSGDTLTSTLTVHELNPSGSIIYSKSDTLNQILLCAYDPNDKSVTPKGFGTEGYVANNQNLEYLIRFQNTGNDTAITVMIRDQLDINLDWTTLHPIASSHPMQIWVEQDGEAVFKFENIMLPDSNVNEIASHGFVKFSIDMKPNLTVGTEIDNEGHIYFDNNPAVITNTVLNTIYDCSLLYVDISVGNTTLCLNEVLTGYYNDSLSYNNHTWSIDGFYTNTDSLISWVSDTTGTFNMAFTSSNPICTKDSTFSIQIKPSYYSPTNTIICQGDSLLLYGTYQSTAGFYYDSLQTVNGCDSIFTTTLTTIQTSFNQAVSACEGDSVLIGSLYQTTAGVYTDSLQAINGCDSIIYTTLTIDTLPYVNLMPFNPDTVCLNDGTVLLPTVVPATGWWSGVGLGGGVFDPALAGLGTHEIIYTGSDLTCYKSDTTYITVELCTGINEMVNDFGIIIYPNPSNGRFTIEKPTDLNQEVRVKLLDATSKLILEKIIPIGKQKTEMDIRKYSKGVYFLQLIIDDKQFVKQLLKD